MQILRCLSLACATAIVSSPLLLRADNEAQIRAREALEQKMDQMNTEPVTSTPPPAVTNTPPPAPAPKKSKSKPKPAPVEKPAPPPVEQPAVSQSAPPVSTPAPPAPKPVRTTEKAPPAAEFAPPPTNTQSDDRLQNALQQKMTETPAPTAEQQAPLPPPAHKKEKKVANNPTTTPPPAHPANPTPTAPANPPPSSLPPLQGPASPISSSKQQQLESLLQQYRADQITPQQYHEQRAKILSEP